MKTSLKIILGILIIPASFIITYRIINQEPTKGLAPDAKFRAIIENSGCILCHNQNPKLPYYSKWPYVGNKIKRDASKAIIKIDINKIWLQFERGEQIDITKLNEIEQAIHHHSMPPFSYTILRPSSAVNSKEAKIFLDWTSRQK